MNWISNEELNSVVDMLKENIDRMRVTNTLSELEQIYEFVKIRLNIIYVYNKNRLIAEEERNDDWDYE